MATSIEPPCSVFFAEFELDLQTGELVSHGQKQKLQQKPFQVLAALLERPGQLVSRDDLVKRLWPSATFVDFDQGLNKAVNRLREALGDSAEEPRFIERLPRRGYRFLAQVKGPTVAVALTPKPEIGKTISATGWAARSLAAKTLGVCALLTLMIVLEVKFTSWTSHSQDGSATSAPIRSLAVLPMENLSGDPSQEYFADGMTDVLITDLGQISTLRVTSRTSIMVFKKVHESLPKIARELGVDAVVEGTVLKSGNQVRITAQLIDARTDTHLWAQSYAGDLRDVLALQNEVSVAIADQIRIKLKPHGEVVFRDVRVVNPKALEAYLKGRYFWNKRTKDGLERAIGYFSQAISDDPNYALAYSGLADCYDLVPDYAEISSAEALPKARAAALKAIELDDTLAEAHTSLAGFLHDYDWDFRSAEKEYRRALELNPNYSVAYDWYADLLSELGRHEEAIEQNNRARELDPLSIYVNRDLGRVLGRARQYNRAIEQYGRTLELDPNFRRAHYELAYMYLATGAEEQFVHELQIALPMFAKSDISAMTKSMGNAYRVHGFRAALRKSLEIKDHIAKESYFSPYFIAQDYALLGENDRAFQRLEESYDSHDKEMPRSLAGDFEFDGLRSDSRYQGLIARLGLPR